MKRKINERLIFIAVIAVIVTVIAVTVVYYNLFQMQVKKDLRMQAEMLKAAGVSRLVEEEQVAESDMLRITWIAPDGTVLYDNDSDASVMGNHSDRPEFLEARSNGSGEIVRESDTMNLRTFYYAVLLSDGSVLRVACEARSIVSMFFSVLPVILILIAIIVLLCILFSNVLTKQLVQPINKMAENLDSFSEHVPYKELLPFTECIRKQHEDVLKAVRVRQDFTANVSHELKTPITAISGYAELIENGMATGEQQIRFAGAIRQNSNRLLGMINNIIELSELDHKEELENFTELDLYEIAKERVGFLSGVAAEKNVEIRLGGASTMVLSSRDLLVELVDNLVQNAIRYNVPNGTVDVKVEEADHRAVLSVKDTGIGIPKEEQSRIFERFYRVDKGRSRESGGNGLGLSIVKHIVELHNGSIELESEVGKGTCISIFI